jgi:phage terminase large subunit GpA-like protein
VTPAQRVARDVVGRAWAAAWTLPEPLTVSEWADGNRILSAVSSSKHGPWETSKTPYLEEVMDALSLGSTVDEVVLMKGSQLGGTEAGLNWIGYIIDHCPAPVMMVQPTTDTGKKYSKQRLAPMIADTPCLHRKVKEARARDSGNTLLVKEFPGGLIVIAGANSAASLRSMPARYLFLDEVDAYPHDVDSEGDPVALAERRSTNFPRHKVFKVSTPATKGVSKIESSYERSDKRRFHVPCPECAAFQWLKWPGLKWELDASGAAVDIRYECEHCGAPIREHEKTEFLARGRWVAENEGARGGRIAGFHLSALYSPLGWFSWKEAIEQFLEAKRKADAGDLSELKVFVNTVLAETFEEHGQALAEHELRKRVEQYPLRTVPAGGLLLVASVDVQGNRVEVLVVAVGRGEESWRIDHQVIHATPRDLLLGQDKRLDEALSREYAHALGKTLKISATAVDSGGHFTHEVYQFCRARKGRHVIAVKGAAQPGKPILGKPSDVEISHKGTKIKTGAQVWLIGTDTAKSLFAGRMRVAKPGPGYLHFSEELDEEYFEQLTSERLVTKYVKGRPKLEWQKTAGKRNEALDLEVYCLAAAQYLGVGRLKEPDWARLERALQPPAPKSTEEAPMVEAPRKQAQPQRFAAPRRNFVTGWR